MQDVEPAQIKPDHITTAPWWSAANLPNSSADAQSASNKLAPTKVAHVRVTVGTTGTFSSYGCQLYNKAQA